MIVAKAREFLREIFTRNPLLRVETGIGHGRWWRSTLLWMLVLGAVVPWYSVVPLLHMNPPVTLPAGLPLPFSPSGTYPATPAPWATTLDPIMQLIATLLFIWVIGRAWSRDASPAKRQEMIFAGITPRQIVAAKTLPWLLPPLLLLVMEIPVQPVRTAILYNSPWQSPELWYYQGFTFAPQDFDEPSEANGWVIVPTGETLTKAEVLARGTKKGFTDFSSALPEALCLWIFMSAIVSWAAIRFRFSAFVACALFVAVCVCYLGLYITVQRFMIGPIYHGMNSSCVFVLLLGIGLAIYWRMPGLVLKTYNPDAVR